MKKAVELLAPAGNMQCLKAAINAGADAVYVGGDRYGARAYAENFDTRQLCEAIDLAHLFGRKLYLTLNTLLKDSELALVPDYVRPFYEAGLDGVIVQDFGVVRVLRRHFEDMELHASTQMTITGSAGAKLLKRMGICRVVPARELSLAEIVTIKEEAGIEVETFIHGAMCYCYSGQCLFSSFLGGRSGNRGRCAGPCRLPYDVMAQGGNVNSSKEQYPISLKDLGVLPILPALLESGIDSFKIEGRMKSPEYVAGVTSIYRKYIDRCERSPGTFTIDRADLEHLRGLYTRGDMQTGYYKRHNGRSMVTLTTGTYENAVSDVSRLMKEQYVDAQPKLPLEGVAILRIGRKAELTLHLTVDSQEGERKVPKAETDVMVRVQSGTAVMEAVNRPMSEEDVQKQLAKMGNTPFYFTDLKVIQDPGLFVPNKELNALRRDAVDSLYGALLAPHRRQYQPKEAFAEEWSGTEKPSAGLAVSVMTREQLRAALRENGRTNICRLYLPYRIFLDWCRKADREAAMLRKSGTACYVSFPPVVRERERQSILQFLSECCSCDFWQCIDGFLVNSLEAFACIREFMDSHEDERVCHKRFQADYGLYSFNIEAAFWLKGVGIDEMTMPLEWSRHEIMAARSLCHDYLPELVVYGYLPLMETAGCIYKTMKQCRQGKGEKQLWLTDRYRKRFWVLTDCEHCSNTILNSVPLSLHNDLLEQEWAAGVRFRLRFTIEDEKQTQRMIAQFGQLAGGQRMTEPPKDYTTGHFRKGVL